MDANSTVENPVPSAGTVQTVLVRNVINIEMKRDKRMDVVVKCESILKDLGYKFQKRTKSDEVWLKS